MVSGAAVVARTAAEVVRRVASRHEAASAEELVDALGGLSLRILDAQPAMAPLVALSREVLAAAAAAGGLEEARAAAERAAADFGASLERRAKAVGARAAELIPEAGMVLTLSSSSTVRASLLEASKRRPLRVACLESRPMSEGRSLARTLATEGVEVLYAVDAAVESLLPRCGVVLVGADSVGDRGVVNKIGSILLARAARRHGVPFLVATDVTKLLPAGFPQPVDDDRPAEEVWRAPAGVKVWNRYFEIVPPELVDRVVTEEESLGADALASRRRDLAVPDVLREWARSRGGA